MPKLELAGFDGVVPRQSPTMLEVNQAQQANNVKLYAQELRYWRGPAFDYASLVAGTETIYKLRGPDGDVWLTWAGDVDVVPGPVADTSEVRVYYTGDGAPKKTNYSLAKTGGPPYPAGFLNLGVPAPVGGPTVSLNGAAGETLESRVYVYTYVSEFGVVLEESAPSPASELITVAEGQTVTVSGFSAAPAGDYNIVARRIYRSVTGDTSATYQFVAEIPIGNSSFVDDLVASELGEVLSSTDWAPPPAGLAGLVALPCASLAGFAGNTVYFSEPAYAHAWPLKYAISLPFDIVGLGVFGTSLAVMTTRNPYIINGTQPGYMTAEMLPIVEPCVSKKSIAADRDGVLFASPNGLVGIGPAVRGVLTEKLFRRDEWGALTPSQIRGAVFDGKYFGFYSTDSIEARAFVLSREDIPALSFITWGAGAVHVDGRAADLYYLDPDDNKIYKADADDLRPYNYEWRSKRFVFPQGVTFSAIKLDAAYAQMGADEIFNAQVAAIALFNQSAFGAPLMGAVNETPLNTFQVNGSTLLNTPLEAAVRAVQVLLYGEDDEELTSLTLTSFDPVRLPPFRTRELEIKIVGNVDVRSLVIATTVTELRS